MTVRGFVPILLAASVALVAAAQAAADNTLADELRVFSEEIAAQCKAVTEQLEDFKVRADPLTGYNLKDAVQSLCVCMPAHAEAFRNTLSPEDLARDITAEEFLQRFNPAVIDKCAAEQMQAMYGEECPQRFKKRGMNVRQYCACMKDTVSRYTEAETAAIAAAASEYLPLAAEAEKNGDPAPLRPPILEGYYQADLACKKK